MLHVNIGIDDESRRLIADGLSRVLADTYTLYLATHKAHWNVEGPMFHSLHAMFMDQYTEMSLAVDELAERVRALGVMAPGSYAEFTRLTSIAEFEDNPEATFLVKRLIAAHETLIRTVRDVLPPVEAAGDNVSADLLVRRLEVHEKTAWMLRSMVAHH